MIFRTKTLISMFRLEDTGSKMSEMLGNPWKSMISGRFAWMGSHANRSEIIDFQGFPSISNIFEPVSSSLSIEINVFVLTFLALSSMCLRVWIQKSQVYSEFIIFSHNIIQNHKFLDVRVLVRIMVGMLARLLVGMYASNVGHGCFIDWIICRYPIRADNSGFQ